MKDKIKKWVGNTYRNNPDRDTELGRQVEGTICKLIEQCFNDLGSSNEWVSADDRLPSDGECVDMWAHMTAGHHQGDSGRFPDCFYDSLTNEWWFYEPDMKKLVVKGFTITHWQSLPLPPRESGE